MLEYLRLQDTGPARELEMHLAPRLNLIAGDNGLGKSFLLDVAWWALSGHWLSELNDGVSRSYPARPRNIRAEGAIEFSTRPGSRVHATYTQIPEVWLRSSPDPELAGKGSLTLYAQADGAFAVFDPYRHVQDKGGSGLRQPLLMTEYEIWNGRRVARHGQYVPVCNGLLYDWSRWIAEDGTNAKVMASVLRTLSSIGDESSWFEVRRPVRYLPEDTRLVPTIRTSYAQSLPVLEASAAVRRVCTLAYMLGWAWSEHELAATAANRDPVTEIVLLFDEVESHLHARWQRTLLPSLLAITTCLVASPRLQLIATTHSPLVLTSIEPHFDDDNDKLFHLDFTDGTVQLAQLPWAKQGDATNWLVSDVFGLRQARSVEAEKAISAAQGLMRGDVDLPDGLSTRDLIDTELKRVLAGHDPFWPRWVVWTERSLKP